MWAADYGFASTTSAPTSTYTTTASIAGTNTPALYQMERWGTGFLYRFAVPNGSYAVTLKFAENYWTSAGSRIFSVALNGQWVLANFDIFAQAGGANRALDETFNAVVTSGVMSIQFAASVDNAKIDAIEILPQGAGTAQPVTVTVSPTFTALNAGGTSQFSALVSGNSNTAVQWSIVPAVGTISSTGLYGAPATITAGQTVTIMATSVAQPTQTASAAISLIPTVSTTSTPTTPTPTSPTPTTPAVTSISPTQISLAASQTQLFTVTGLQSAQTSSGTTTTTNWTVTPSVGTIAPSGLYTAPSAISTQQTVTVNLVNTATAAVLVSASVILKPPTPPAIPVAPAGLTATAGNAQVTLGWTASSGASSYNVGRATVSGGPVQHHWERRDGGQLHGHERDERDHLLLCGCGGERKRDERQFGRGERAANRPGAAPAQTTTIQLPLEVIGPNGTTVSASFTIPAGTNLSGQLQLWMQIHGLRTQTQASVQVNNSGWTPINSSTVTLLGLANAYGGIGGGFHTLTMTMNLPAGSVVIGSNTVSFIFNQTDGRVSGFRVLAFNIENSSGTQLISSSSFVNEDPNTWQPPLNDAADIAAGQTLWRTASLTVPTSSGAQPIQAHCMDCHSEDGRDLKYFNYSNNSIQARSIFHGLTAQQGNQIASYIRSLNVPNPGRPWNPPYQPGPGLDEQPVANWSAGAGIGAVLNSDQDLMNEMFPTGVQAGFFSPNGVLNVRETAIPLQLPDWNSWLPMIHPMDAWGDFMTSTAYQAISSSSCEVTARQCDGLRQQCRIFSELGRQLSELHFAQNQ